MTITTVGIDLAKNVFAVHDVDHNGKTVLVKPRVSRAALPELIASLPPCVIGMEACSGAHYGARLFRQYGHDARLRAPKFVSDQKETLRFCCINRESLSQCGVGYSLFSQSIKPPCR
ncbi:hypothetical protein A9255_03655 [Xenorhabdus hominickii]|uniref:Transposase n=1 Tax=Xenorhabdus hominickii TaxID=351679 RepID=A0A2G0Q2T1_XENHO|nr:hypothetical protein A9255_03655 [Xenorhabdus hominickii]PHM53527.1 transposase [Xenorhabdus hominickii]